MVTLSFVFSTVTNFGPEARLLVQCVWARARHQSDWRVRQEDCECEAIRWQKGGNREGEEEGGGTRGEEEKELTSPLRQGRERECLAPQLGFRPVWQ